MIGYDYDAARCEPNVKTTDAPALSLNHGLCRIEIKNCDVGKALFGSVINVLPECNVEVRLDGRNDTLIIAIDCIRPVDDGSAVSLAKCIFDSGFQAASFKFVQGLCADSLTDLEIPLQISTWLMECRMYQEAESVLHWVLKVNPSVTSGDHLKAMCALAELKALCSLQDDAICLLEAVLQNDPDVRSEHTAFALLRLGRAYTELGDFAEAKRIGVILHRTVEARAAPHGSVGESVTVAPPTPVE